MNNIDQIKAEIERRNLSNYCGTAEQYEEELFTILDTLPEEEPSEDERIRMALCDIVRDMPYMQTELRAHGLTVEQALAYLEKQKEQKPVEPSYDELQRHQEELYDFKVFAAKQAREHHISFVHDFEWDNFCAELLSYFNYKEQNPAEWSEEDDYNIVWSIETRLRMDGVKEFESKCKEVARWLKSLHGRITKEDEE